MLNCRYVAYRSFSTQCYPVGNLTMSKTNQVTIGNRRFYQVTYKQNNSEMEHRAELSFFPRHRSVKMEGIGFFAWGRLLISPWALFHTETGRKRSRTWDKGAYHMHLSICMNVLGCKRRHGRGGSEVSFPMQEGLPS
ncbi:hypothetical protein DM02DRAFT_365195 [Periconia macrospinosa]|uniref:Uncharacterized protein n=1 Tax=Periconia macrospinosa TaxID=97972 RepID=A0A2V1DS60_9PLEO|nr:hypothetical protein DM02DRAFT_365195 [Periconia macrospinosa]